jgi:Cu(I)/Ag(I) efflux system membrane protein CusA/SilA
MLLINELPEQDQPPSLQDLQEAIMEGACMRIRPIMMTVLATIVGLIPVMLGQGAVRH